MTLLRFYCFQFFQDHKRGLAGRTTQLQYKMIFLWAGEGGQQNGYKLTMDSE